MTGLTPPSELAAKVVRLREFIPSEKCEKEAKRSSRQDAPEEIVTEDNAAQQFAESHAGTLRYCHSSGSWFIWTGTVWKQNKTGLAFQWARELARDLSQSQPNRVKYITSKVGFAGGIERFAKSDPRLAVEMDAWDYDPFLLGTPGGTVDLRTGVLRPSDPADGITKLAAVSPSETADYPRFLAFLYEATRGDEGLIRFIQRWCGYALTADTKEQTLVFVCGPGGNGKSVFLNVLTGILQDYAATAAMETFTAAKGDRHPTDMAMLRGARLVTASETEEGKPWAESRIKQMTGGDLISARFMRQDFFTFRPAFKLTIVGNHKPVLRNVDDAMRRRFRIIPFVHKPEVPDRELEQKLRAEWPSILRWMIEGCLDWQMNGLASPQSVTDATESYFSEQDTFGHWLEEECESEPPGFNSSMRTATSLLYAAWRVYAQNAGEDPGSIKTFTDAMRPKGYEQYRSKHSRGFKGVALKPKGSHVE